MSEFIPHPLGDHRFDLIEDDDRVRRFSDADLQDAIDAAIRRRNPEKDLIVVGHIDRGRMYMSAAYRFGDTFSVVAAAYKSREAPQDWGAGAEVIWEPF